MIPIFDPHVLAHGRRDFEIANRVNARANMAPILDSNILAQDRRDFERTSRVGERPNMVPIFDHHIHMDARDCNGYEAMALASVERVLVPCSPTGERKASRQAWSDRFDRLLEFEARRAETFGIQLCAALAVCASDAADPESAIAGVDEVVKRLGRPRVVAIGELCMRAFSDLDIELFTRQLRLANELDYPVIVEAPIEMQAFERMLLELEHSIAAGFATPRRISLIDVNYEKIKAARSLNLGAYGVPVSPKIDGLFCIREKLDHHEVLHILDEFGPNGLMLNSGLHVGFADPLGLPKTILRLRMHGLDVDTLRALAMENADGFFQPSCA